MSRVRNARSLRSASVARDAESTGPRTSPCDPPGRLGRGQGASRGWTASGVMQQVRPRDDSVGLGGQTRWSQGGSYKLGMRLHHFTARDHLESILKEGRLRVTESNLSDRRTHAGPDVVWLTDEPSPDSAAWAEALYVDRFGRVARVDPAGKLAIRITVDVPDAVHWPAWARSHGIRNMWYRKLAVAGGDPKRWWVVERPIWRDEWVSIVDMNTGDELLHDVDQPAVTPNG